MTTTAHATTSAQTQAATDDTFASDGADLVEAAIEAFAGATPMAYMDETHAAAAAARLAQALVVQPPRLARRSARLSAELTKVALGASKLEPEPGDKRFADEAWTKNPFFKRLGQSYLAWNRSLYGLIDELDLDEKSRLRSRFVAGLFTEAVAPTNFLLTNPAALREATRTRGRSLLAGARHFLHDVRSQQPVPSMVDTRPFEVGKNLAATPGAVVFRNEVLELIQYQPREGEVHQRPLVIVPPQVNKFYVLDLAPGRSLAEAAVGAGHQVFMVSWRNPGPDQREWTLDTYVSSLEQALDAALDITGQPDLNILAACAGGVTSAAMAGHLAAIGDRRINAMTFLVTALDSTVPSTVSTFASGPAVAAAARRSRSKGVLEGRELASMFAWLRPNDLVWNYWVNNYLLGKNPPAFDILAWNADATNVPAGLHGDFLTITSTNALANPGHLEVLGSKVDLGAVTCDAYVVGGLTDHIIPWQACYESMKLLGGQTEFVLCKSGHIQTLVCPTDNAKAAYLTSPARPATADDWMAAADEHRGSWWTHWLEWLSPRAGDMVGAPAELGSANYPAGEAAPGSYVLA